MCLEEMMNNTDDRIASMWSSTQKMGEARSSETSVKMNQTALRHMPEDSNLSCGRDLNAGHTKYEAECYISE
jgi:hypothetical protein